jgi:hypothetical protein
MSIIVLSRPIRCPGSLPGYSAGAGYRVHPGLRTGQPAVKIHIGLMSTNKKPGYEPPGLECSGVQLEIESAVFRV